MGLNIAHRAKAVCDSVFECGLGDQGSKQKMWTIVIPLYCIPIHTQMQQREVPPAAVQQWQEKVESSHGDVWRVLKEEREEKEMRQVGKEANIPLVALPW